MDHLPLEERMQKMEPEYGTFMSTVTWEDVRLIKEKLEELNKADAETKKKFYTRVGLYDEDGNVVEFYKGLFQD